MLLGEYGSGKTSCCLSLCYRLLKRYTLDTTGIFPVYLSFRSIGLQNEASSAGQQIYILLTENYQIKLGPFSEATFKATLKQHNVMFILDGLDEIVGSLKPEVVSAEFQKLREVLSVCKKVLITCRTNYFPSEADVKYIFPLSSENIDLLDTIIGGSNFELRYLADLDRQQQEMYLRSRVQDEQRRTRILETLQRVRGLSDLARRPILLSMIVRSFEAFQERAETITQTVLYDQYTRYWLLRDREGRIPIRKVSLDKQFFVLERLALKFFSSGEVHIHHTDLIDFLSHVFEQRSASAFDGDQIKIDQMEYIFTTCSFLTRTKDNYFGFAHRSFLEFFAARALRQDILANTSEFFGRQRLFGLVATFLAELIEHEDKQPEIEERLVSWVLASRDPNRTGLMTEAGLDVSVSPIGNTFGRLAPDHAQGRVILTGSHTDSVIHAGRFDGVVGVVCALEVLRVLRQIRNELTHPIEMFDFVMEESSRFGATYGCGSYVMAGGVVDTKMLQLQDSEGVTLAEAIQNIKQLKYYPPSSQERPRSSLEDALDIVARSRGVPEEIKAYVELHIEQGQELEEQGIPIGVVTGAATPTRVLIDVIGQQNHSGTTPMRKRKNALCAASEVVLAVDALCLQEADCETVGAITRLVVEPNVVNVVPGRCLLSLDLRGTSQESKQRVLDALREQVEVISSKRGIEITLQTLVDETPIQFSPLIEEAVETSCSILQIPSRHMPSRAGHDACHLTRLIDEVGMIFVPSKDGISHNPAEWTSPDDIYRGAQVLLLTLLQLAME